MIKFVVIVVLTALASSIPFQDQILLANSLIVGRDDYTDLYNWECKVCDSSNKPTHSHYIEDKKVDIKCIISVYSDMIVLAFRYTNTALNVWYDILYPIQVNQQNTCSNCKVQKAYFNMWGKIKQEVFEDLRILKQETGIEKLCITGISLGGGLASISYVDINHLELFETVKIVTFGAPRVGNKYWSAHFDLITLGKMKRYIVSGDPIVVMPRCLTTVCTYRQTGVQIVCYEEKGECVQEEQIPDDDDELSIFLKKAKHQIDYFKDTNLQSIMDHVEGYPKIYNSTLILE